MTKDISKQKALEEGLENLVARRTTELTTANNALSELNTKAFENNEALKKSNLSLEQFSFIVSHDLQEPLRKIQAFGDLLFKRHAHHLGDGAAYLSKMQAVANHFCDMLSSMASQNEINKCYMAGATSFFVKPVEFEDLKHLLVQNLPLLVDHNKLAATDDTMLGTTPKEDFISGSGPHQQYQ